MRRPFLGSFCQEVLGSLLFCLWLNLSWGQIPPDPPPYYGPPQSSAARWSFDEEVGPEVSDWARVNELGEPVGANGGLATVTPVEWISEGASRRAVRLAAGQQIQMQGYLGIGRQLSVSLWI